MSIVKNGACCVGCRKLFDKVRKCGRCKVVFYCSVECQRDHWPEHKKICRPPESHTVILKTREVYKVGNIIGSWPEVCDLYKSIRCGLIHPLAGESKEIMITVVTEVDENYVIVDGAFRIIQAIPWSVFQRCMQLGYAQFTIDSKTIKIPVNPNHEQGLADMKEKGYVPIYIILMHPINGAYPIATSMGDE